VFSKRRCVVLLLIVSLPTAGALVSCKQEGSKAAEAGRSVQAGKPVPVHVAVATQRDVPLLVRSVGMVGTCKSVQIRPQVTDILTTSNIVNGQRVVASRLVNGQRVGATQPLFTIDPRASEAALQMAQSNLARDVAQYRNATTEADRQDRLFVKKYASETDYMNARTAVSALTATTQADEAAIRTARLNLENCQIFSPTDGVAGRVQADPGNLVVANSTLLVVINQIQPIDVFFSIPQRALPAVQAGLRSGRKMPVRVSIPGEAKAAATQAEAGELYFVDNAVDKVTGSVTLGARFGNADERLWPGQFVNVVLALDERKGAVVVPAKALQTTRDGKSVMVVKADQTIDVRPVKVAQSDDQTAVIEQGLAPGAVVVTDGHFRLTVGTKVEIKPAGGESATQPEARSGAATRPGAAAGPVASP